MSVLPALVAAHIDSLTPSLPSEKRGTQTCHSAADTRASPARSPLRLRTRARDPRSDYHSREAPRRRPLIGCWAVRGEGTGRPRVGEMRSVRVRATGAMAALAGLGGLGAGRRLWKLPVRLSAGLQGCGPRRGYIVSSAEVRTHGVCRSGACGREDRAGHRASWPGAALRETVEPQNPSTFPKRCPGAHLPPAGRVLVCGKTIGTNRGSASGGFAAPSRGSGMFLSS